MEAKLHKLLIKQEQDEKINREEKTENKFAIARTFFTDIIEQELNDYSPVLSMVKDAYEAQIKRLLHGNQFEKYINNSPSAYEIICDEFKEIKTQYETEKSKVL
jgi:hypothetical protein